MKTFNPIVISVFLNEVFSQRNPEMRNSSRTTYHANDVLCSRHDLQGVRGVWTGTVCLGVLVEVRQAECRTITTVQVFSCRKVQLSKVIIFPRSYVNDPVSASERLVERQSLFMKLRPGELVIHQRLLIDYRLW